MIGGCVSDWACSGGGGSSYFTGRDCVCHTHWTHPILKISHMRVNTSISYSSTSISCRSDSNYGPLLIWCEHHQRTTWIALTCIYDQSTTMPLVQHLFSSLSLSSCSNSTLTFSTFTDTSTQLRCWVRYYLIARGTCISYPFQCHLLECQRQRRTTLCQHSPADCH